MYLTYILAGGAEEVVTLRETLVERCPTNYAEDMDSMLLRREDAGENTDTPSKGCYFDSIYNHNLQRNWTYLRFFSTNLIF